MLKTILSDVFDAKFKGKKVLLYAFWDSNIVGTLNGKDFFSQSFIEQTETTLFFFFKNLCFHQDIVQEVFVILPWKANLAKSITESFHNAFFDGQKIVYWHWDEFLKESDFKSPVLIKDQKNYCYCYNPHEKIMQEYRDLQELSGWNFFYGDAYHCKNFAHQLTVEKFF